MKTKGIRILISAHDSSLDGSGASGRGRWWHSRQRCHGGSPESGQLATTELGLLRGFTLRDRGDEGNPLRLPRGSGRL
jgi:hypothetical protein